MLSIEAKYLFCTQNSSLVSSWYFLRSSYLDFLVKLCNQYAIWQQLAITEDQRFFSTVEWQRGDNNAEKYSFIHRRMLYNATVAWINSYCHEIRQSKDQSKWNVKNIIYLLLINNLYPICIMFVLD